MSETDQSVPKERRIKQSNGPRTELLLALIQHGSRPAAIALIGILTFFWLFSVKEPLSDLLCQTQELKVGSFAIRVRETARIAELGAEYKKLETLSLEQIQLFLIVGARREAQITYRGPEVTKQNLEKLQEVGLLRDVREVGDSLLHWSTTEEGAQLQAIIIEQVVASIRSG